MSIIQKDTEEFADTFIKVSQSLKISKDHLDKSLNVYITNKNRFEFLKALWQGM